MTSTIVPFIADTGTLTFSSTGSPGGYIASPSNIGDVISADTLIQSDGSLTIVVSLKLSVAGAKAPKTAFVNVVLQSKLNGVPVVFEKRLTDVDLGTLIALQASNPISTGLVKFNNSNVVSHIKFTFDNVLLPGSDGLLPNEVIGVNAYEQNNGGSSQLETGYGNNFPVAYQSVASNLQGISVSIAQNPGRPSVSFTGVISLSSVGGGLIQATVPLRIKFPSNNGGSPLRTYNIFMMVESLLGNKVVAQLLNKSISSDMRDAGFVDIDSFNGIPGVGNNLDNCLVFSGINDGDTVYYVASVDNLTLKESQLSFVSPSTTFTATLRVPKPTIVSYRSAEILLPTGTSNGYLANVDIPGVKFTFTADLSSSNWNYVSVWARPAGAPNTEQFRMGQMFTRVGDVADQLAANGFCEKIWNKKFVNTNAGLGSNVNSVTNDIGNLPAMTAFDIYIVLSFNADIANTGSTLTSPDIVVNTAGLPAGSPQASQSNPSDVVRVITSIYRPALQTISTLSNISVQNNSLVLNSTFPVFSPSNQVSTSMPSTHNQNYYSGTNPNPLLLRCTVRANDFSNNNQLIFDGEVTPTGFNAQNLTVTAGQMPPSLDLILPAVVPPNDAASGWLPTYSFSFKNVNLYQLNPETLNAIIATDPKYISPDVKNLIVANPLNTTSSQNRYLAYYTFSTLEPVRTKPVDATLQYLPRIFIDSIKESRLISGGTGLNPTYGKTQLAALLSSAQAFNVFPYKWNNLEVQVSNSENFTGAGIVTVTNNLTNDAALLAEILYLAQNLAVNNNVVSPQTGTIAPNTFDPFLPNTTYYVRLKPTYTWSGAGTANILSTDRSFTPTVYYGDASSTFFSFKTSNLPPVPSPLSLNVTFSRQRALKLVGSVVQSEPTLLLIPNQSSSRVSLTSTIFQLVNGLNVPFTFPGSKIEVNYVGGAVNSLISAAFSIPTNQLDQIINVSVTYKYTLLSDNSFLFSAPVRSADVFYENPPNVILMEVRETATTVQCIAHIELGVNDQVPVNTNDNSINSSGLMSNGLYNNQGMFLTALIPAIVNSYETFAHNMIFVPVTSTTGYYQTSVLTKINNPEIYTTSTFQNTSFIVIANNNTGHAIAMYPKRSSSNSVTWNINSSVAPLL